jgi:hypothetical protein
MVDGADASEPPGTQPKTARARCSSRPGDVGSGGRYDEERHRPDWWSEKIGRE